MSRVILPYQCILGKVKTTIEVFKHEKHFESLFQLCYRCTKDSQGLGEDDMDTREKVNDLTKSSRTYVFLDNEKTSMEDKQLQSGLFAGIILYPSPTARSTKPATAAGTLLVDSTYRSAGIGSEVMKLFSVFSADEGYLGISGRMAISARSPLPALATGTHFLGTIPRSVKIPPWGWVNDLIAYYDLCQFHSGNENLVKSAREERMSMPPLNPILDPFLLRRNTTQEERIHNIKGNKLTVRSPCTVQELEEIHVLYRNAAQESDGYAMDEFTEKGLFSHKLLKDVTTLGVFTPEGAVVAAAMFGKSAVPRIPGKCIGGYIVVSRAHQQGGIGTKLLRMIEQHARDLDLDDLIFDVFTCSQDVIQWLIREGYVVTGTIPNSGVVKNNGFTDTAVMYKSLNRVYGSFPFRNSHL